ncbi:MAG: phage tail protein [Oscillospiraceae bacterium]|nr:phage tail protein [Oscillospiraceae bacterium]
MEINNNNKYFHGVRTERQYAPMTAPYSVPSGITFAVGAAPVHTTDNPIVNEPIRTRNWSEAERLLGYNDDWQKYDLSEVMFCHFRLYNTSPVIFVNVLDPARHKKSTPAKAFPLIGGRVILPFETIKSSVKAASYVAGTDYELFYHDGQLVFEVLEGGAINSTLTEVSIGFDEVDPSMITAADIIGGTDLTTNERKGLENIEAVFPKYGILPSVCICPNWSSDSIVASVMAAKMEEYNGVFNGKALIDVDTEAVTFYEDVPQWKEANGITSKTQVLCFPLVSRGGKTFRMSTHMAGLMAVVDAGNDNVPCESPSNKPLHIDSAVLADGSEVLLSLTQANYLNAQGITTALNFVNGFVLWGNHTAIFPNSDNPEEYFLYAARMFDWISNTVILTHWSRVDGVLTQRTIESIVDILNIWLNGLVTNQRLIGGRAEFPSELNSVDEFRTGKITFKISFAPPGIAQEIVHLLAFDPAYIEGLLAGLGGES